MKHNLSSSILAGLLFAGAIATGLNLQARETFGECGTGKKGATNTPPAVTIIAPGQGASFLVGTNISIYALSENFTDALTGVAFYSGTNLLGETTNIYSSAENRRETGGVFVWSNAPAGSYTLTAEAVDGAGNSAVSVPVYISVVTALPPTVSFVHPDNGASYSALATINLSARANDPSGTLAGVEFFAGTNFLGEVTNTTSVTNDNDRVSSVYNLVWTTVPPAVYSVTAVALDSGGLSSTSAPISITVHAPPPPSVKIVSPENGQKFTAPAKISIAVTTLNFTNPVASVQFLAGTNNLGTLTSPSWPTYFNWTNASAGSYSLTALATDSGGFTATSSPVTITVSTNQPARGSSGRR